MSRRVYWLCLAWVGLFSLLVLAAGRVSAQTTNFQQQMQFQNCHATGVGVAGCGYTADITKSVLTTASAGAALVPRNITAIGGGAGIRVTDVAHIAYTNGARVPVEISRVFTAPGLASAFWAAMRNPYVVAGTVGATVLWEYLEDKGGVNEGPGILRVDPGQAAVTGYAWTCRGPGGVSAVGANPTAACHAVNDQLPKDCGYQCTITVGNTTCSEVTPSAYACDMHFTYNTASGTSPSFRQATAYGGDTTICPQTTLAPLRFQYGGPCASDNRVAPTQVQVEQMFADMPDSKLEEIGRELWSDRFNNQPGGFPSDMRIGWPSVGTPTTSTPSPVTTSEGTVTRPDGTVETKKTEVKCTISGSTATCNQETKTVSPQGTTTETGTKEESKSECEKHPDTIGCSKYGEVENAPDPKAKTVAVGLSPVDFGGGSSSCPAASSFSVMGRSYALEWQPVCNVASVWLRPLFLLAGAVAAALIVIGGLKA